jgi:hypothetical protein
MPSLIFILLRLQGDQIGRILVHWVTFFFGKFWGKWYLCTSGPHFWCIFIYCLDNALVLLKSWVGRHFGRFFRQLVKLAWNVLFVLLIYHEKERHLTPKYYGGKNTFSLVKASDLICSLMSVSARWHFQTPSWASKLEPILRICFGRNLRAKKQD